MQKLSPTFLMLSMLIFATSIARSEELPKSVHEVIEQIDKSITQSPTFEVYAAKKFDGIDPTLTDETFNKQLEEIKLKAKVLADKKYPRSLFKKTVKEALNKYKAYKIGDKITIPVRYGRGFKDYTGKLVSIGPNAIIISNRRIPRIDLPESVISRLDPKIAKSKAKRYVSDNYHKAKRLYLNSTINEMEDDLRKRYEKNLDLRYKYEKSKKKYSRTLKYKALKNNIPEYLQRKLKQCESATTAKDKFQLYNNLVTEAHVLIKTYGKQAQKVIKKIVNLKKLENKLLPDLERKAAFENQPDEKEKKPSEPKKVYYSGIS